MQTAGRPSVVSRSELGGTSWSSSGSVWSRPTGSTPNAWPSDRTTIVHPIPQPPSPPSMRLLPRLRFSLRNGQAAGAAAPGMYPYRNRARWMLSGRYAHLVQAVNSRRPGLQDSILEHRVQALKSWNTVRVALLVMLSLGVAAAL